MSINQWTLADRINLSYIWLKSAWAEKARWKRGRLSGESIRVFYGRDQMPSSDENVFGGLVKILDLQTVFPNRPGKPNILYMVSSALPYFPVRMARLAKKFGAKVIINQNGVAYPGWYGDGWEQANKSMAQLIQLADYVVYQSHFCKTSADKFLGRRIGLKQEILFNPVDTSFFCPDSSCVDRDVTMLLAGSHWSSYRVATALETLQRVRKKNDSLCLRIAGRFCWLNDEQQAQQEVLKYAQELGVAEYIDITGSYTQKQAPELLNQCSILLHTKYNDPCPRLVVEAMACGLPVVYSATGGVPELVGDEAGVGVAGLLDYKEDHPPNAEALAIAVEQIVVDLGHYSKAARSRAVRKFDVRPWLQRHEEIFHQVFS